MAMSREDPAVGAPLTFMIKRNNVSVISQRQKTIEKMAHGSFLYILPEHRGGVECRFVPGTEALLSAPPALCHVTCIL